MIRRWTVGGLMLVLGACASAPLATERARAAAGELIDRYDETALRSIVTGLGYSVVDASVSSSGKPFLTVEVGDGAALRIMGESCEGEGVSQVCRGVQLSAQFAETGEVDFDEIMAVANRTLRPAKVFRVDAGLAYERYLIMDGGVSHENLETNISVYVEILQALLAQISP